MNQFPQMIYKAGGAEEIHGGKFDYIVVEDADELATALADGWHLTTDEARNAGARDTGGADDATQDNAAPNRAELEAKAKELGIEFSPRLGDAKLTERIEAALAAKG